MRQKTTRDRHRPLKVWVSPAERETIENRAKAAGLSVSAYLRILGLGHVPKSVFNQEAVLTLAKINSEQGRLSGLIERWLDAPQGEELAPCEVRATLLEIAGLQRQLRELAGRV